MLTIWMPNSPKELSHLRYSDFSRGRTASGWDGTLSQVLSPLCLSHLPSGCSFHSPHSSRMPETHPDSESAALSYSNYQHIFSVALESYEKGTGNDLTSNPLLPRLETCNSPDAVITLLLEQIPGFDRSRSDKNSERLSNWLNPTVNVIAAFSGTISGSAGPVGCSI